MQRLEHGGLSAAFGRWCGLAAEANVATETKAAAFTVLSGNAPTDAERTAISQESYAALLAKIEQLSTLETPNQ